MSSERLNGPLMKGAGSRPNEECAQALASRKHAGSFFQQTVKPTLRSLRFRLMAWNAAVVALAAVMTLVGMRVGLRRALVNEMDRLLVDRLGELSQTIVAAPIDSLSSAPLERSGLSRPNGQRSALVMTDSGDVLWSSDDRLKSVPLHETAASSSPTNVGAYRVVQERVRLADGKSVVLRVGVPLAEIESDIKRIDKLALAYAACVLAIAPLVGYWLAGRVVLPLRDLIHRTASLRPVKRGDRLAISGAGDELDQLAGTINGLIDRIGSYLRHREDFVANAAHELRNPVAAIRSTAEVALGSERTKQEYENLLEEMIEECARLELLVSQLLLLSESDANRLRPHDETLDLSEIVRQATATFGPAAESLDIHLQVASAPALVDGNRQHLQQVVSNLLDNALKFTQSGGSIRVSLETDRQTENARFVVSDGGIGIQEADLPHVFERFYRGDKSRAHDLRDRGAGLGLSICKSIVEAHGGSITVASRWGHGATFTVLLPLATLKT